MIGFSGFILVDDDESQLNELHASFVSAGYPCLPIRYVNDSPEENPTGVGHVNMDIINPRVIITDLNLNEQADLRATSLVGSIADLLRSITKDGPYILYFWSKNDSLVGEVMSLLESRTTFEDVRLPMHWGLIKKSEFLGNPLDLSHKIQTLISDSPMFHALFEWESRVAKAAQETSNSLYSLTQPQDRSDYQSTHKAKMAEILAVIGNESAGHKNAKEFPNSAIDSGLSPVLIDRLMRIQTSEGLWNIAVPNIGDKVPINEDYKSTLNTFFHVEETSPDYPKNNKGVFVKITDAVLIEQESKKKLESKLGKKLKDIVEEEFISTRQLEGKTKTEMREFRAQAHSKIELGFLELSADCDQAQKKVRLHRYILAALIPIEFKDITIFESGNVERSQAHEGIYRVPVIKLAGEDYILKLSFKYQIGTIPSSKVNNVDYINKWLGEPKFRLKEQILGDISFKCAQYSTREDANKSPI